MHPFKHARRLMLSGIVAVAGVGSVQPAAAQQPPATQPGAAAPAAKPPEVRLGRSGELVVPLGGQVAFAPKVPGKLVKTVLVSNDSVVRVAKAPNSENPNEQLLTGLNPGIARLTVVLNDDTQAEFEVLVQPDYDLLRKVIKEAVPTASVNVVPGVGNSVILTGFVNKPEDADIVVRIAQGGGAGGAGGAGAGGGGAAGAPAAGVQVINAIQVGGSQHVQIEVVIAQVDRTELRQRGADFSISGRTVNFDSLISGLIQTTTGTIGGQVNSTISPAANLRLGIAPAGFLSALQALRSEGLAKFLSEPKVVTQSGRPAFIRSGGQQAVLSANGGFGGVSVTLEQVGTQMEVVPIVLGQGKILLEVFPSVRTRNDGFGVTTTFGFSPGFTEQSTRASVTLESGQTYAIGGLLETSLQNTNTKVPFVGDLPFVGPAFSRTSSDLRERELIILVTPRLVDAMDCSQVPRRVPGQETRNVDDYELFLEGLLEAPRGQRQVWNGKCYNAAYKCDPTYGLFPCRGNVCGGGPLGGAGCTTGCGTAPVTGHPAALPTVAPAAAVAPASATEPPALPPVDPITVPDLPPAPPGSGEK